MQDERGFAIPVTVLLIALITVMLTSGFVRVRADRQVAESQEVSAKALSIARAGLAAFFDAQATRPADGVVDTMYVTGGYAIVTGNIVQNPADTLASQTWIVRSTGYVIDAATGTTARARRTVAQFAEWQSGTIKIRGALTAPNGIQYHNRGTIEIRGDDQCFEDPSVPGIRAAGLLGSPPTLDVTGSPGIVDEGASNGGPAAAATAIDWIDVRNGGIVPDYTAPPYANFTFPTTVVYGNLQASSPLYGSGLLIVTGNLTAQSWVYWYGVILVGGGLVFESYFNYVFGAVVTGLNEQLPTGNPARTELGWTGSSSSWFRAYVYYHSCFVDQALEGLTGFAPIDNAWVDNWATY